MSQQYPRYDPRRRFYYVDFEHNDVSIGSEEAARMSNAERVALARRILKEEGRGDPGRAMKIWSATYVPHYEQRVSWARHRSPHHARSR